MLAERFPVTRRIPGHTVFFATTFFTLLGCSDSPELPSGAGEETRPGAPSSAVAPPATLPQAPSSAVEDPAPAPANAAQPPDPSLPLADDFALSREWVEAMLEENESRLSEIRQRLQSVRIEIERIESSQADDGDLEGLRARLAEILTREREGLERIRSIASEMKEILDPETAP